MSEEKKDFVVKDRRIFSQDSQETESPEKESPDSAPPDEDKAAAAKLLTTYSHGIYRSALEAMERIVSDIGSPK